MNQPLKSSIDRPQLRASAPPRAIPNFYRIESGFVIPPRYQLRSPVATALGRLSVGDSILVSTRHEQGNFLTWAKRLGVKITTRKIHGQGIRVWRIA